MRIDRHIVRTGMLIAGSAMLALSGHASAGTRLPAPMAQGKARVVVSAVPGSVTLYDQNGNDAGSSHNSQNYESQFDAYDDQSADDFVVPDGHKWTVKEVDVTGLYSYGSPASSENVFFYQDNDGLLGNLIVECASVQGKGRSGSFVIKLPDTCPVKLKSGRYWLSVQTNQDFGCCGEWFWEETDVINGEMAAWQQPGNAWGTGCMSWNYISTCWGGAARDLMFALKGKDKS